MRLPLLLPNCKRIADGPLLRQVILGCREVLPSSLFLEKLSTEGPGDGATPRLGINCRELKAEANTDTCTLVAAASFTTAERGNTPGVHRRVDGTVEHCSALERKGVLSHAAARVGLENSVIHPKGKGDDLMAVSRGTWNR